MCCDLNSDYLCYFEGLTPKTYALVTHGASKLFDSVSLVYNGVNFFAEIL